MTSQKPIRIPKTLPRKFAVCLAMVAGFVGAGLNKDSEEKFLRHVQERVEVSWHPPAVNRPRHTVVSFIVNKDGVQSNERVMQTSGDEQYDADALRAVKGVFIFKVPPGKPDQGVQLYQSFDAQPKPPFDVARWLDGNRLAFNGFTVGAAEFVVYFQALLWLASITWLAVGRNLKPETRTVDKLLSSRDS